jgi:hypothetical protein
MDLKKAKELLEQLDEEQRKALPEPIQEVLSHLDGIVADYTKKGQSFSEAEKKLQEMEQQMQQMNMYLNQWEAWYNAVSEAVPREYLEDPRKLQEVIKGTEGPSQPRSPDIADDDDVPVWERPEFRQYFEQSLTDSLSKTVEPKINEIRTETARQIAGLANYLLGIVDVVRKDPEAEIEDILKVSHEKGLLDPRRAYEEAYGEKLFQKKLEEEVKKRLEEERNAKPPVSPGTGGIPPEVAVFKPSSEKPLSWEEAEAEVLKKHQEALTKPPE